MRLRGLLLSRLLAFPIFICFLAKVAAAEQLPFSFYNNAVKVLLSRSRSETESVIKLEVKATGQTGHSIFAASNPSRLVVDFRDARFTRSRTFTFTDSDVLRSVRCGVHPNHLRVVLEFKTDKVPPYTIDRQDDWFTITVRETGALEQGVVTAGTDTESELSREQFEFRAPLWNKSTADLRDDGRHEQTGTNHLDLRPALEYEHGPRVTALASGRFDVFSEFSHDNESTAEARLHETYLRYSGDSYHLGVGNQIVTWGKADEISPLDNLNPEDFRDGPVRRRSERKIPIPMVTGEVLGDEERFQAVYIPFFRRSRVDFGGSDWALFGGEIDSVPIEEDIPGRDFSNGEFGVRYAGNFQSFDFAFSFLSAHSDIPVFGASPLPPGAPALSRSTDRADLAALVQQSGGSLSSSYPRREIYGIEFETVYESFGVRGDLAYVSKEKFNTTRLESVSSAVVTGTIGVDYSSVSDMYFNVQYAQSYIDEFDSFLMAERIQHNVYSEISQEFWDNKLKLGFRSLIGFPLEQQFYNPYLSVSYWDNLLFEFGCDIVSGEQVSPIGFYDHNDQGYLLTTVYF